MPTFNELGLKPELLKAVETLGFNEPMPIQAAVIPELIQNPTDMVGLAQTGTGKTAAFGLPLLHHIDSNRAETQALILCPTRELCVQITRDLDGFAQFLPSIRITAIYGGASIDGQIKSLQKKPQIVVATPGRLQDMMRRRKIDMSKISWVVLDEADEMLDMGFQEEVDLILSSVPDERHILLFSATMPAVVESILARYMKSPVVKSMGKRNSGTANVRHSYYLVHAKDRYKALKRIVDFHPAVYGIVFCRTRAETQEIADQLINDGYNAGALHGDLSQVQRDHVMNHFREGNLQILVATDVAARGLDVNNLTHVINYSLPDDPESYVHRSGRTGRADKTGVCISLAHMREKGKIRQIEKQLSQPIAQAKIPTGMQVCEKQLFNYVDKLENVEVNHKEIEAYLPVVFRKLEWMSREELIKRFVSIAFNRFLDYYRDAPDLNVDESRSRYEDERPGRGKKKPFRERGSERGAERGAERGGRGGQEAGYQKLFVSLGRKDSIKPAALIGLINQVTRSRDVRIGQIKLMDNFSFVDVDDASAEMVINAFKNKKMNPDNVRLERVADDKKSGGNRPDFKRKGGKKRKG
ncbi:MAG: DEAD/DEAH box helicase [Bacteroidetes bacterium]|nr:DEAD/DEAH box helicase [Bacteroidota bacterium]MBU1580106.1 DEAD/DEAH box helicase [Bacteroidota bacterium]MBU2557204.1 DEAD/DEAH box helicase [Bacteroidota bacterium]